jgi:hypothetical protein
MLVYRVETPAGFGPYGAGGCALDVIDPNGTFLDDSWELAVAHNDDDHLPPRLDGDLTYIAENESCGFESASRLIEWFQGWGWMLHRYGFRAVAFEVDDEHVRKGEQQVVFRRDLARQIATVSIAGV